MAASASRASHAGPPKAWPAALQSDFGDFGAWRPVPPGVFCKAPPKTHPRVAGVAMVTENEHTEPDCQRQFQAAVSVIQNLPKNGEGRWKGSPHPHPLLLGSRTR